MAEPFSVLRQFGLDGSANALKFAVAMKQPKGCVGAQQVGIRIFHK
jgi:hypothetical protein